jgi:hypothetical protein
MAALGGLIEPREYSKGRGGGQTPRSGGSVPRPATEGGLSRGGWKARPAFKSRFSLSLFDDNDNKYLETF